jgi:hypothetical protein
MALHHMHTRRFNPHEAATHPDTLGSTNRLTVYVASSVCSDAEVTLLWIHSRRCWKSDNFGPNTRTWENGPLRATPPARPAVSHTV